MHFGAVIVVALFSASVESASLVDNKNVPLAILTSNSIEFTPAKVGSIVSADFLSQTTLASISENVEKVVFVVLPKLSFPRLVFDANYNDKKDTYFLSNALALMNSVVYPGVSNIDTLLGNGMTVLHVKSPNDLRSEDILNGGRKIQIKLDSSISLHDADSIFDQVLKLLNGSGRSFSLVYTANEPDEWVSGIPQSHKESAELSSHKEEALIRYKRQVSNRKAAKQQKAKAYVPKRGLELSNQTVIFYGADCFLFYATKISVMLHNTTTKSRAVAELPNIYRKAEPSDYNCTSEVKKREGFNFTIDYDDVGNFTELRMTFGVKMQNAWEWHVHAITFYYKTKINGLESGEATFKPGSWLNAQVLFSYHCNKPEVTKINDIPNALKGDLEFGTIQTQAYDLKGRKFGWQCDCVGFFTSAIWAGLFVSIIYLLIIALAMVMLVNLETMDRFEDPKGHGLKIQASG